MSRRFLEVHAKAKEVASQEEELDDGEPTAPGSSSEEDAKETQQSREDQMPQKKEDLLLRWI